MVFYFEITLFGFDVETQGLKDFSERRMLIQASPDKILSKTRLLAHNSNLFEKTRAKVTNPVMWTCYTTILNLLLPNINAIHLSLDFKMESSINQKHHGQESWAQVNLTMMFE